MKHNEQEQYFVFLEFYWNNVKQDENKVKATLCLWMENLMLFKISFSPN